MNMRFVPVIILIYIWLVAGLADPGALLGGVKIVRWFTYILIPLVLISGALFIFLKGIYKVTVIDGVLLLLVAVLACSTYLNNRPFEHLVYGVLVYLKYPLLFIVFHNLSVIKKTDVTFMKLLFFVSILIALEAVVNFLVFGKSHDATYFTLGITWGTMNAGILLAYFLSFVFSIFYLKGIKSRYVLILLLILAALYIASVRSSLVFLPLIALMLFTIRKGLIGFKGIVAISVGSTVVVFYSVYEGLGAYSGVASIQYRLDYIREVFMYLYHSDAVFLGMGPRSMSPGSSGQAGFVYQYFLDSNKNILMSGSNQYVKVFSEMGVLGFLLYWYMLVKVLAVAWKYWLIVKGDRSSGIFCNQAILCLSFFGMWIFYSTIGLLFNDLWRMDASSLVFWVVAAKISHSYNLVSRLSFSRKGKVNAFDSMSVSK